MRQEPMPLDFHANMPNFKHIYSLLQNKILLSIVKFLFHDNYTGLRFIEETIHLHLQSYLYIF